MNVTRGRYKSTAPVVIFVLCATMTLLPVFSSAVALLFGMAFALLFGNPVTSQLKRITPLLLQVSVVGLGAGMDLGVVGQVGAHGMAYTVVGITVTMALGVALGRWLKVEQDTSLLVTVGTAICGGSAIAAAATTLRAKSHEVSVALATVFFLNAAALFIFPPMGHALRLNEVQFGLWSALAVHDTSSVVGTAMQFGARALEIATTVKLARALWIIPVTFAIGLIWRPRNKDTGAGKAKRPWFILGFVIVAALVTWIPGLRDPGQLVASGAKRTLVLTLFLIGSGLTRATMKSVGFRPFIQGFLLWVVMGGATLGAILMGVIT